MDGRFAATSLGLALAALSTGFLLEDTSAAPRRVPAPRFAPDAADPQAPPLDGSTWSIEADTYSLRLRSVDAAERRKILQARTGSATDPFATRPDRPESFLTFLLELDNRGQGSLVLHPQNCWLITANKRVEYPLDLDTLRSTYHMLEQELPAAYEAAGKALLGSELILSPGESASGLLVYRRPAPRLKRFSVELPLSLPTGEVARFRAPYRRVKE